MLCNIIQNSIRQTPRGGTRPGPAGGGEYPTRSGWGYPARGYPGRVPPSQVRTGGVPCQGYPGRVTPAGYPPRPGQDGGYSAGGYPYRVPPSRVPLSQDGGTHRVTPQQGTLHSLGQVRTGQVRMGGTLLGGTLPGEYPGRVPPSRVHPPGQIRTGGYPVRTTEGVLTTRWAVCLLRSRRRTFLYLICIQFVHQKTISNLNIYKVNVF